MFNLKSNLTALREMAEMLTVGFFMTSGGVAALYLFDVI